VSQSLNDKLAAYFSARPGQWIDGKELATVAGGYGWRTRCSDLRKRGMAIENRVRHFMVNGSRYSVSEYRYVPGASTQPSESAPHDLNQPFGWR
jgi:hypothetical protein